MPSKSKQNIHAMPRVRYPNVKLLQQNEGVNHIYLRLTGEFPGGHTLINIRTTDIHPYSRIRNENTPGPDELVLHKAAAIRLRLHPEQHEEVK